MSNFELCRRVGTLDAGTLDVGTLDVGTLDVGTLDVGAIYDDSTFDIQRCLPESFPAAPRNEHVVICAAPVLEAVFPLLSCRSGAVAAVPSSLFSPIPRPL
jgi:hypothetical protein